LHGTGKTLVSLQSVAARLRFCKASAHADGTTSLETSSGDELSWAWPRLAVPAHFEILAFSSEDPGVFRDYMAVKHLGLWVVVPTHEECITVAARARLLHPTRGARM
jgi:hypothetical protein